MLSMGQRFPESGLAMRPNGATVKHDFEIE